MSSVHSTHGVCKMKNLELSQSNSIKMVADADGTKSISLALAGAPTAVGDVAYSLPVITSAQTLLHNGSNLNGANLTAGSVATGALADDAVTADKMEIHTATDIGAGLADADSFLVSDSDAGNAVKRVTGSALKTYVGSLPASSDGNILVSNAGTYASVAMSSDATIANTGALTISNSAINNAKVSATAGIEFSKLENLTSAQILVGSATNVPTSRAITGDIAIDNTGVTSIASGVIVNADVNASAGIDGTKISPVFNADVETGSANAFYFGANNVDGTYRIVRSGNDLVFERRETGSYVTKFTISA